MLAVGTSDWDAQAKANGGGSLCGGAVVVRDLLASIAGVDVQDAYGKMHAAVADGGRREIAYDYHCDAPHLERHMRLTTRGRSGTCSRNWWRHRRIWWGPPTPTAGSVI